MAASARIKWDSVAPISTPQWSKVLDQIAAEARLDLSEFFRRGEFRRAWDRFFVSILQAQMALILPVSIFQIYPTVGELQIFFRNEFGSEEDQDNDN